MIELDSVVRTFGERTAIDNVSFAVRDGRMTGFVGANGAGKTTTMRIILGVLAANGGTITMDGRPISRAMRRQIGYMPEERGLYPKMKIRDQLVYLAKVYGVSAKDAATRADALLEELGLASRAQDELTELSLGNQQRVQIAAALIHDPQSLVLDEPFSGLDPLAVDFLAELVRSKARTGAAVLFSSHQLDLVERLCDDIVILSAGKVIASGSVDDIRDAHTERRLRITVHGADAWLSQLGTEPAAPYTVESVEGATAVIRTPDEEVDQALLQQALSYGTVREFGPIRPTLAEIFRESVK